jgi:hypothetical protein
VRPPCAPAFELVFAVRHELIRETQPFGAGVPGGRRGKEASGYDMMRRPKDSRF